MITIKIENARDIVEQEKGRLVSRVAPLFMNVEKKVEQMIVAELAKVFVERNIEARIEIHDEDLLSKKLG